MQGNETDENFAMEENIFGEMGDGNGSSNFRTMSETHAFDPITLAPSTTFPGRRFLYDYNVDMIIEDQFVKTFQNETLYNHNFTFPYYNVTFNDDNLTDFNNATLQLISELEDTFDTNYTLLTFVSSCLFFDTVKISWSSEGCKVPTTFIV